MVTKLEFALRGLLAALMGALVLAVSWQVISRYVLSAPSVWTEELARFLLVWIGVLGASYAYRARVHLAIDLLPRKLGVRKGAGLEAVNASLVGVFAAVVMMFGGGRLVLITWELNQISPALGWPMAVVYSVVPLSGALLMLFACLRFAAERALAMRSAHEVPRR